MLTHAIVHEEGAAAAAGTRSGAPWRAAAHNTRAVRGGAPASKTTAMAATEAAEMTVAVLAVATAVAAAAAVAGVAAAGGGMVRWSRSLSSRRRTTAGPHASSRASPCRRCRPSGRTSGSRKAGS